MDPITLMPVGLGASALLRSGSGSSTFTYRKKGGSWRAYFNGKPPSMSHVLHDRDGYYVCWDRAIGTEREMRKVAQRWVATYG